MTKVHFIFSLFFLCWWNIYLLYVALWAYTCFFLTDRSTVQGHTVTLGNRLMQEGWSIAQYNGWSHMFSVDSSDAAERTALQEEVLIVLNNYFRPLSGRWTMESVESRGEIATRSKQFYLFLVNDAGIPRTFFLLRFTVSMLGVIQKLALFLAHSKGTMWVKIPWLTTDNNSDRLIFNLSRQCLIFQD